MLDMKFVRDHLGEVQAMLERRHNPMKLDDFAELEKRRREILGEVETLKGKRNAASKEISVMKKNGENADALVTEMRAVGDKIASLDGELKEDTGRRGILEIKTTTIQNKAQWDEWEGGIPQRYYAQILHQLSATGWQFAIQRAYIRWYRDGEFRATVRDYRIERDDVLDDIAYLREQEMRFMDCVNTGTPPAAIITMRGSV